jgi:DNA-binding transcriptional ArsR family regulator
MLIMEKQYMMFDINDSRAALIAEVLGNKTCTKILSMLSEKEMSEGDLTKELKLPSNTVHYNVQKLVSAGFVEASTKFFWSTKGKKIVMYKISNKKVIISPKTSFKGILPALLGTGVVAFLVKLFASGSSKVSDVVVSGDYSSAKIAASPGATVAMEGYNSVAQYAPAAQDAVVQTVGAAGIGAWSWFLLGAWAALLIFVIFNIRRDSLN